MSEFVYVLRGSSANGRGDIRATVAILDAAEKLVFEDTLNLSAVKDRQRFATAAAGIVGEDNIEGKLLELLERAPGEKPSQDSKPKLTARFPGLVDVVEHEGRPHFLLVEDDLLRVTDYHDGQKPPDAEHLPFLLPRFGAVVEAFTDDTDGELFRDLMVYLQGISQLPTQDYYLLLAAWTAHTYLVERWQQTPIIVLYATPERGKSRTGKAIMHISYRGIHTETVNEANLFRWSNDLGATLFLDVRNLWRKALQRGADDILLQRFERGARVGRVLYPEKGPFEDTRYFDVYGATIVATNEAIQNVLETRCLTIVMPEADKDYPKEILPEVALPLKERLVAFRARYLNAVLPAVDKPCGGRLGEILRPLSAIVELMVPDRRQSLDRLIEGFVTSRQDEKAATIEAAVLEAMLAQEEPVDGVLLVGPIAVAVNESRRDDQKVSNQYVGQKMKALGFAPVRAGKSRTRGYTYDKARLNGLAEKWGLGGGNPLSACPPLDINQIADNEADNGGQADKEIRGGGQRNIAVVRPLPLSEPDRARSQADKADNEIRGGGDAGIQEGEAWRV